MTPDVLIVIIGGLVFCLLLAIGGAASETAKAKERQNRITSLEEEIKYLKEQLVLWQNKALPNPLGFETRERKVRQREEVSPLPKILTRKDIIKRRQKNEKLNPVQPKYATVPKPSEETKQKVVNQAKEILGENNASN